MKNKDKIKITNYLGDIIQWLIDIGTVAVLLAIVIFIGYNMTQWYEAFRGIG